MTVESHVLAGAYVCDALDRPELEAFEAHLAQCETCSLEVAELRATVAALAVTAIEPPPPGLRTRVLDQIVLTGQVASAPASEFHRFGHREQARWRGRPVRIERPGQGARPGGPRPSARADRPGPPADAPRRRWARMPAWSPAAAMLAGLLALGAYAGYQHHQIAVLSSQSASGGAVASAADAKVAISAVQSGGMATVISSRSDNEMVFSASALPVLPAGEAYQLWLVDSAGTRPGPVLSPVDGSVPGVVTAQLDGAQWVAMTVEPTTGSAQPTSAKVLMLPLH
jgi:hypothetical protein